jgi:hypothetical protein
MEQAVEHLCPHWCENKQGEKDYEKLEAVDSLRHFLS